MSRRSCTLNTRALWTGAALALLCVGCHPSGAAPAASGEELYASCEPCHGPTGEGNERVGAPAIARLPKWYILGQLTKFRTGLRGAHPDDAEGLRMRPMSRMLHTMEECGRVAEYVVQLPQPTVPRTLTDADLAQGKAAYATCSACHGPQGLGNEAMKAPSLAGQADWYLVKELGKFKAGIRGYSAGDVTGSQMRPMAGMLTDEKAIRNVVGYISTLSGNN